MAAWGCEPEREIRPVEIDGIPDVSFSGCPWNVVENLVWCNWMMRLYQHYKIGHLWNNGGIGNQPLKYLRAMEIIDAELNRIRAEEFDKAKIKKGKK